MLRRRHEWFLQRLPAWVIVVACAAVCAEEKSQPGIDLLANNPLTAWSGDQHNSVGWTFSDGKLSGTEKATPLAMGRTLADFELHIEWSVAESGAILLSLPKLPEGDAVELRLSEEPGVTIRLPDSAHSLKTSSELHGKTHKTVLRRNGDKLVVTSDGIPSREIPLPAADRFDLSLSIDAGAGTFRSLRLIESAAKR